MACDASGPNGGVRAGRLESKDDKIGMTLAGAIMDLILMGLLLTALAFGVRLNARLKALKTGQEAFAQAVAELDQAAIRAHESLMALRQDADETQELLHGRIKVGRDVMQKLEAQIQASQKLLKDVQDQEADLEEKWRELSRESQAQKRPLSEDMPPRSLSPSEPKAPSALSDHLEQLRQAIRANHLDIAASPKDEPQVSKMNQASRSSAWRTRQVVGRSQDEAEESLERGPQGQKEGFSSGEMTESVIHSLNELMSRLSLKETASKPEPVLTQAGTRTGPAPSRLRSASEPDLFAEDKPTRETAKRAPNSLQSPLRSRRLEID